jgi:mitochondrial division protein 1
MTDQLLIIF